MLPSGLFYAFASCVLLLLTANVHAGKRKLVENTYFSDAACEMRVEIPDGILPYHALGCKNDANGINSTDYSCGKEKRYGAQNCTGDAFLTIHSGDCGRLSDNSGYYKFRCVKENWYELLVSELYFCPDDKIIGGEPAVAGYFNGTDNCTMLTYGLQGMLTNITKVDDVTTGEITIANVGGDCSKKADILSKTKFTLGKCFKIEGDDLTYAIYEAKGSNLAGITLSSLITILIAVFVTTI